MTRNQNSRKRVNEKEGGNQIGTNLTYQDMSESLNFFLKKRHGLGCASPPTLGHKLLFKM